MIRHSESCIQHEVQKNSHISLHFGGCFLLLLLFILIFFNNTFNFIWWKEKEDKLREMEGEKIAVLDNFSI